MTTAAEPATAAHQQAPESGAGEDQESLVRSDPAAGGIRRRRCGRSALASSGPGNEEENGSFGLAAIRKEHVHLAKGQLLFEYTAKSAKH